MRTTTCGEDAGSATPTGCAAAALATTTWPAREEYAVEPAPSAVERIAAAPARRSLGEVDHDPALRELDRRLADLGYLAADLAADLSGYLTDVEVDPARLAWVQQRRADLTALTRKYGETIDDVLDWGRGPSAQRLDTLMGSDSRIEALEPEVARLTQERTDAARALTKARGAAAAKRLAAAVTGELGAPRDGSGNRRRRRRARAPPGLARHGVDDVEILLAANPGGPSPHGGQGGVRR